MGLYRICRNLWVKGDVLLPGAVSRLGGLSSATMEALLDKGLIRPVSGPPILELRGWALRGRRLAEMGIVDSVQMLEVDPDRVAAHFGVSPALVRRWQEELEKTITLPPERGG